MLTVRTANPGVIAAGGFDIAIRVGSVTGELLATQTVSSLVENATHDALFFWNPLDEGYPIGAESLFAFVDSDQIVAEFSERNNRASLAVLIKAPLPTPTPTPTMTPTFSPTHTPTNTPTSTPDPFAPLYPGDDIASPAWEFNRDGDREGWSGNGQTSGLSVAFGSLSTTCAGWDPQLYSPVGLDLSADFKTVIELRMKTTAGSIGAIYFKSPADANFTAGKKVLFSLINGQYVTYRIDMKGAAGWSGIIDQLRLDPTNHSGSEVKIDSIRVCLPLFEKAPAWEFNRPARLDGWTFNKHLSDAQVTGGAFQATASGSYPSLYSPIGLGVSAENHPYIETVMDVTAGNRFRVWFRRTGDSDFASDRCTAVPLSTHPGPAKYLVDMSALPSYTGVIDQIRLNPTDAVGASVSLDAVRFCMPLYEKDPLWNFDNDGDTEGWTAQHDLTEPTVESGVLKTASTGNDSRLISPYAPMDSRYNRIFVAAMRISQGDFFDLFFCQFGVPGFAGRKRVNIPRHDERVVYAVDLGTCPNYADYDIHTLRLDPTNQSGAEVIVDSLCMLTPVRVAAKSFEFNTDGDLESWRANGQLTPPAVSGGSLRATSTGADPILLSPAGLSIDADATDQIVLRMKTTAGSTAILFYRRATDTGFSSVRQKAFRVFNNSDPVSYCLDMSADPNWSGTIVGLRLDPTSVSGADLALDYLRIYGPAAR